MSPDILLLSRVYISFDISGGVVMTYINVSQCLLSLNAHTCILHTHDKENLTLHQPRVETSYELRATSRVCIARHIC